jgi:hypothetical protein
VGGGYLELCQTKQDKKDKIHLNNDVLKGKYPLFKKRSQETICVHLSGINGNSTHVYNV